MSTCPICGKTIPPGNGTFVLIGNSKYLPTCNNCGATYAHSCMTCRHQQPPAPQCLLEKYSGPLDVVITQRTQHNIGSMFMIQEMPQLNEEVVKQICPTCPCCNPQNCQEICICDNWDLKEELNKYVIAI